jgi:XTP/dITP diphosphohydrolase
VGFEWENRHQVWEKVKEEINELEAAVNAENIDHIEDEMGDVFFSLVNYSRFIHVDAENALERTNKKFISRFNAMEVMAAAENKMLHDLSLEEMDQLWNQAKQQK